MILESFALRERDYRVRVGFYSDPHHRLMAMTALKM